MSEILLAAFATRMGSDTDSDRTRLPAPGRPGALRLAVAVILLVGAFAALADSETASGQLARTEAVALAR